MVKALNLYSNLGVGNHSNVNTNSNARGASKNFWMQKTQTNWIFLTWSLCFIAFPLWPLFFVLWFLCFSLLSLGVALHYIHAFHSRCFLFYIYIKKKKKRGRKEKEAHCVFALFSLFLKTGLVNLFSHDMSLVLLLWNFKILASVRTVPKYSWTRTRSNPQGLEWM